MVPLLFYKDSFRVKQLTKNDISFNKNLENLPSKC